MRGSSADASRMSGFALTLNALFAVIQLGVVAFAAAGFDEVADAVPFGRTGTIVLCAVGAVVACTGAVMAWRGAAGPVRATTATMLVASAGMVALLATYLVIAGGALIILVVPLAHAAFSIVMIARSVVQNAPALERR